MLLTAHQLQAVMPDLPVAKAEEYAPLLAKWCGEFKIDTSRRLAAFLATLAEESGQLRHWRENLNYSAAALQGQWPRHFDAVTARRFARKPIDIANYIYGVRKARDLGNRPDTTDGWDYRGGGPIQATGRAMYAKINEAIGHRFGIDLLKSPHLIAEPEVGIAAACWIWAVEKELNPLADKPDSEIVTMKTGTGMTIKVSPFTAITRKVNGGETHLKERMAFRKRANEALGVEA